MSRVRSITMPDGEIVWFDTHKNGLKATDEQLELLATATETDLDDLLDEGGLTQEEVITKLRKALNQGQVPPEVIEKRQRWREERRRAPRCRICDKQGDSTRHHFINKWILRELEYYEQKWADRSKNCIPVCIDCHRDLHSRDNGARSIVPYLEAEEREFAEAALHALSEERPKLLILLARGDRSVYESQLVKDWLEGNFQKSAIIPMVLGEDSPVKGEVPLSLVV